MNLRELKDMLEDDLPLGEETSQAIKQALVILKKEHRPSQEKIRKTLICELEKTYDDLTSLDYLHEIQFIDFGSLIDLGLRTPTQFIAHIEANNIMDNFEYNE